MAGFEPDWSRISEDLLFSIVKLLPTRIDVLRLRAVCRSFRATIPPPPIQYPFPHSILTNTDFLKGPNPEENGVFTLTVSTVYAIEPLNRISNTQDEDTPQTWLVNIHESNSGRVRILDPVTGETCKKFSEKLPKSLNLLDYRVSEIGKFYQHDSADDFNFTIVVFPSFLDEHDDEFAVMMRDNDLRKVGMWRNVDQKWSYIDIRLLSDGEFVGDIIYYNDKFYALLSKGRTVTVDPKSLMVTQVAADLRSNLRSPMLSLVGSFNDLFLVAQDQDNNNDDDDEDRYHIEVFKLNQKKRKWVRVVDGLNLVDRVLFVDRTGYTFSVSVKEFPRFKGGCVYYAAVSSDDECPGECTWICDLGDGKSGPISIFPGYLNFFWPPPAWLNDRQELMASAGEEKQRRSSGDNCERKIPRLMP